jgi:hypothetical protein
MKENPSGMPSTVSLAPALRRYPGTRSFDDTEEDQRLFTGRDAEMEDLYQRIASHRIIVLYAASGTGKSSLLRAGVFPLLRKGGYLPLSVRFDPHSSNSLSQQLAAEVSRECERQGSDVFEESVEPRSFLRYFQGAEFWGEDGPMTPVLVLDQFEELFYLHTYEQRETLMRELGALIKGWAVAPLPSGTAELSAPAMMPSTTAPDHATSLRVVLSLREDAIGHLLALGTQIPGLMSHAVRLQPLTLEAAAKAVTLPAAELLDSRYTPPFLCEEGAVTELIAWLAEKSRMETKDTATALTGAVESFVLQIFCEQIEEHVIAQRLHDQPGEFTTALFPRSKHKERVLQAYYHRKFVQFLRTKARKKEEGVAEHRTPVHTLPLPVTSDVRLPPGLRRVSRVILGTDNVETALAAQAALLQVILRPSPGWRLLQLLENDLITKDGRRQPGVRSTLQKIRRLSDDDVALLETMRLVRTEPHGGTQLLNLSHDQLAAAIYHHSILRQLRQVFLVYGTMLFVAVVIFGALWDRRRADEAVKSNLKAVHAKEEANNALIRADAARKELAIANAKTAELAKSTAQRAGSESEAISSLALAVQADPADDEAFYDLLSRVLNFDLALPDRLWTGATPGTDCKNCTPELDADRRHFVVVTGDSAMVWDAAQPTKQPLWAVTIPGRPRLALGRHGTILAGLTRERSQERKLSTAPLDSAGWQFVIARQGEGKGDSHRVSFASKEIGNDPMVELSPEGQWLLVAVTEEDSSYKLVYALGKEPEALPPLPTENANASGIKNPATSLLTRIRAVAFHPKDELLAVIDSEKRCWLWRPATKSWQKLVESGAVRALFSPDGEWLVLLSDERPLLWSTKALQSGRLEAQTLSAPKMMPSGYSFSRTTGIGFSENSQFLITDDLFWRANQDPAMTTATAFVRVLWARKADIFSKMNRVYGGSRYFYRYRMTQMRRSEPSENLWDSFRIIDDKGRWGLEDNTVVDLAGAVPSDRFRIFGKPSSMLDEEEVRPGRDGAIVSTESEVSGGHPLLRQLFKDGSVAEWLLSSSRRLRLDRQALGGPGRQGWLSSDAQAVFVWDPETRSVWRAEVGGPAPQGQPLVLPEGWQPLNLTANRWLIARTVGEPARLAVWNIDSRQEVATGIALPESASRPNTPVAAGVSNDGRYLGISYESDDFVTYCAWMDVSAASSLVRSWSVPHEVVGQLDFTRGEIVTPPVNGGYQISHIYPPIGEPHMLPVLSGESQKMFLHSTGERITVLGEEQGRIKVQTIQKKDAGWQAVSTPLLAGRAEPGVLAESDDRHWLVGLEGDKVLAWRIGGKNVKNGEVAPLLRLDLRQSSIGTLSLAFCANTHRLAIGIRGEIALIDLDDWMKDTSPEDRQAFAEFAASFASVPVLASHLGQSKENWIEPATVLRDMFQPKFDKSSSPLSEFVAWCLGKASVDRPAPYATLNLTEWASRRRDTATPEGVKDALEVNPNDSLGLAMLGWLAAKSSKTGDSAGYWDAAFYHALHQPNLEKADEVAIYAFQAKAMNALKQREKALEAIAAGEKAEAEAGAQVNDRWRTLLQEARAEAQRIQP